jgi:dipeptidyl aminopeptidase/acylaminoacyl peptidase
MIVWLHGGQIWTEHGPLVPVRGSVSSLAWSPDSTHLAFTSDRTDHALIGVYDKAQKTLRYLDPSVDTDRSPAWSPDGRSIAFIRIPASREAGVYGAKRTGQPWSIRVVDLETGKGREVWHAQEGPGSVFWPLAGSDQLHWTAVGNIVFPWERDGWQHLYSLPAQASAAILLTPGNFEVDNVTITPDRKSIVFSSNQGDIDRRHLWRVDAGGGVPARLTNGAGIEWSPASLNDGSIAFLHSDKFPARAALLESSGRSRDFAATHAMTLDPPEQVIFAAADGMQIHGQVFLPPTGGAAKHPAVVFFHGGSRRQMLLGWHPMQYYNQAYGFNQYLASLGYVVLSVNYRSGIGYGTDFREALRFGPTGASEYNDVQGAAKYLQTRTDVDPARIGAWGGSYGGYLTALALARASNLFAVGVDLHGIYDWNLEFTDATSPEFKRLARESSPIAAISTWKSPVLLIQGDDDRNVAFSQTVQNVEALRKQGVPFEQIVFPDEVHEFLLHADWLTAYHAADEFLARHLKP